MTQQLVSKAQVGQTIEQLLQFARQVQLVEEPDCMFVRNALLEIFQLEEPYHTRTEGDLESTDYTSAVPLLECLLDYAAQNGIIPENSITYRDLLDARIMGLLTPRPSEVSRRFWSLAYPNSPSEATDYLYRLSIHANYIRMDRIQKNVQWLSPTPFGDIEITINLSKPEKDPKEIAMLKHALVHNYPKCLLCVENVGYAGRFDYPARQNLRTVPIQLNGETWHFQYSPYVYYPEHSILLSQKHVPMKICKETFERIFSFIDQFPHYFIGSNADIPIVGGSILHHDHFQAGKYPFPLEKAPIEHTFHHPKYAHVQASIVRWPMSIIRLTSESKTALVDCADHILKQWKSFSDSSLEIISHSETNPEVIVSHNTITPIGRMNRANQYELDLVLRNNRTTATYPEGIFHPHRNLHHIKKENIGLIEVMGLAVLPGRLEQEMAQIARYMTGESRYHPDNFDQLENRSLLYHAEWMKMLIEKYGSQLSLEEAIQSIKQEIGFKFLEVLEHAGVYKRDERGRAGFMRFMAHVGFEPSSS